MKMVAIIIFSLALLSGAASEDKSDDVVVASSLESWNSGANATAVLEQFPSIVQVDFLNQWGWWGWNKGCAGSILTQQFVMTAASCVSGPYYHGPNSRRIRAGASHRHVGGVIAYVDREFNYAGFRNYTTGNGTASVIRFVHDISVVKLQRFLAFTNLVRQASILQQNFRFQNNQWLNQIGWGQRYEGFPLSLAQVRTFTTQGNQSQPLNYTTTGPLTAVPTNDALNNVDVGGLWMWHDSVVGLLSTNHYWNGTVVATRVSDYSDWIVHTTRFN